MSKTFTYTKTTGHYFCMASDEWEEYGIDFDYQVEDDEILPVLVNLLFEDYFESEPAYCDNEEVVAAIKEKISNMLVDNNLVGFFANQYEDTLKEIFESDAMEWYNS